MEKREEGRFLGGVLSGVRSRGRPGENRAAISSSGQREKWADGVDLESRPQNGTCNEGEWLSEASRVRAHWSSGQLTGLVTADMVYE